MQCAVLLILMAIVVVDEGNGDSVIPFCVTSGQRGHNQSHGITIRSILPKKLGLSVVCQFTAEEPASFLSIQAQKHSNGILRVAVYDFKLTNNIGRLEIKLNRTFHQTLVCLGKSYSKYAAIISGTPLLNFTVKIRFDSHRLQLNKDEQFSGSMLFFYSPPEIERTSKAQLDITVKSSNSGKAVLMVSSYCDQVENLGVINRQKPTMSLTFEKQGRMTLSKVSHPNASQALFIGILHGDSEEDSSDKNFTIRLTTSFRYDYAAPMCFIVFFPAVGGIMVALWALFCFREPLDLSRGIPGSSLDASSASSVKVSRASSLACWSDHQQNELTPLIKQPHITLTSTCMEVFTAMLKVLRYHRVGNGSRSFSYITCVVGFVLFVGAFQFVYENWNIMIEEGDRDKCFYNDLCYRVSPYSDIPFNLMISNLAYVIHGMILAIAVWVMEAELYVQANKKARLETIKTDNQNTSSSKEALPRHALVCSNINVHLPELSVPVFNSVEEERLVELYAHAYKKKYSFSVGYAFAWSLIFEGLFSLTYHLCPSRLTFQFDTAFMFVISGLIIVSLFNGLSVRECHEQEGVPRPIEDTSFYLYVIVPLYLLNYLGSIYNVQVDISILVVVIFFVSMIVWYLVMLGWSARKLFYSRNGFHTCESQVKVVLFCLTVGCTCVVFPILFHKDLSQLFLFSCITIAVMSTIGKIIITALKQPPTRYSTFKAIVFKVMQILYVVVALGIMIGAVYVFDGIPTTDKTDTPAQSRNLNKECALLEFYDYHDIWHIMSSFGLLMGAFLVMYISE